jgi:hypothetical protein
MSCFGDGKCMTECNDRYCYKLHEISKYKFCKKECKNKCELIMCKNWVHCNSTLPAYCYKKSKFTTNGVCNECNILKVTFLNEKRECFICYEIKYMIVTDCNHEMCFGCLFNLDYDNTICPFCASEIKNN